MKTPPILEAAGDCVEVKKTLAASVGVDVTDEFCTTALMWASSNGHAECVKLLLAADANVNAVDVYGSGALDAQDTPSVLSFFSQQAQM
jgi:ankyrin repeat protein